MFIQDVWRVYITPWACTSVKCLLISHDHGDTHYAEQNARTHRAIFVLLAYVGLFHLVTVANQYEINVLNIKINNVKTIRGAGMARNGESTPPPTKVVSCLCFSNLLFCIRISFDKSFWGKFGGWVIWW